MSANARQGDSIPAASGRINRTPAGSRSSAAKSPATAAVSLAGLMEILAAEGIDARRHQIHHGICAGYVARPAVESGRFVFSGANIAEIRQYLAAIPHRGRKSGGAA